MSASSTEMFQRNRLLSLLKPEVHQRLLPLVKSVTVDIGQSVSVADRPTSTVYFPLSFVSSSLKTIEDGVTVEIATVGNEGFVGLPLLLGSEHEPIDSIAQIEGEAIIIAADDFIHTIEDGTTGFRNILLRYTQAAITQVVQNAACNQAHTIEQRCARWILMTHDRVHMQSFILARQFLSYMLVVPEARVPIAMAALAKAHLITYIGARIHVVDRQRLEEVSCTCYGLIRREYDRLLTTTGV
jgi:CRP-like cAMP-binding protein